MDRVFGIGSEIGSWAFVGYKDVVSRDSMSSRR